MIDSFRDVWLRDFYIDDTGHRSIPANIESALRRKLDILDMADTTADLRIPPGNRFESLQGRLAGWCAIRVNKQYRLIFQWNHGRAHAIYLDPHRYG